MIFNSFVFWFSFFLISFNTDIPVRHDYLPRISASSIADGARLFEIKGDYLTIRDFLITNDAFYLTPGELNSKGFATSIIKLSREGELLGEIYRSANGSILQAIAADENANSLFAIHSDKVVKIDPSSGKILQTLEFKRAIDNAIFFQGKLALTSLEVLEDRKIYYLEMYDPESLKLIRRSLKLEFKFGENPVLKSLARNSSLTENNGDLLISLGEVNQVFSSKYDFESPIISFTGLYEGKESAMDILFSANQGVVGRFATTGFRYLNQGYTFFYDLKERRQYLSKVGTESGVYDDFHQSGFYSLQFTNSGKHLYSYLKSKSNEGTITVILLDIKS